MKSSHNSSRKLTYRIFIPIYYNKDDPYKPRGEIEQDKLLATKEEVEGIFGGLFVSPPQEGHWRDEEGNEYTEPVYILEADIGCRTKEEEEEIHEFMKCYKGLLKKRFRQKSIYIEWFLSHVE